MTVVDQITIGIGQEPQNPIIDEVLLDAINVTEDGVPPPPPREFAFPWWLVGIGAVAAVAIRTRQMMKKERP